MSLTWQKGVLLRAHGRRGVVSFRMLLLAGLLGAANTSSAAFWGVTGPMAAARQDHTATVLPDGRLLVVGGRDAGGALASAEIFDPARGAWTSTGPLLVARYDHSATMLPSGKVMVAGGRDAGGELASAELYDPATGLWSNAALMLSARADHTATLLRSGKLLVAGGSVGIPLDTAELFEPASNSWSSAGLLNAARARHTATLLANGRVLVVGGSGDSAELASAEIYDPAGPTWTLTGALTTARRSHTATLLATGEVLVTGGSGPELPACTLPIAGDTTVNDSLSLVTGCQSLFYGSAFYADRYQFDGVAGTQISILLTSGTFNTRLVLYDSNNAFLTSDDNGGGGTNSRIPATSGTYSLPASGRYTIEVTSGASQAFGSGAYSLTLTGSVTAATYPAVAVTGAELFGPATGTWTSAGATAGRFDHTAALLSNSKVLIVGGQSAGALTSAQLYDRGTNTWAAAGALTTGRAHHAAALLTGGRLLVCGGADGVPLGSAEFYDATAGDWTITGAMSTVRRRHRALLLPSGKVMVTGGIDRPFHTPTTTVDLFDPAGAAGAGSWSTTGSLSEGRYVHTMTLLANGKVLVVGGHGGVENSIGTNAALPSAEVFDPAGNGGAGSWSPTGSLQSARRNHTATLLSDGRVLVTGGESASTVRASAEIYDPVAGTWSATQALSVPRSGHSATLLPNGLVLVVGGSNSGGTLASAELYDPQAGTWTPTGSLSIGVREGHTASLLPSGRVLLAGGFNATSTLASAELYDPAAGTWSETGPMPAARGLAAATVLQNGEVAFVGGWNGVASGEYNTYLYDPATGLWRQSAEVFGERLTNDRMDHSATLLPDGRILVAGGGYSTGDNSAELYDLGALTQARRPIISTTSGQVGAAPLTVTGSLRGDSEAGFGGTATTSTNYPLLQLRSIESERTTWLVGDPRTNFSDEPMTLTVSDPPPTLDLGWHLLTVFTNGLPSVSRAVEVVTCALSVTQQPASQTVPIGGTATFSVNALGGRSFQWQRDGIDIPGATGLTYTTPPVVGSDSGTTYRARITGTCTSTFSNPATLTVADSTAPAASVVSPSGGEYWLLSEAGQPPNTRLVTWSMSDNVRVCRVEASLWYSNNGGVTYLEAAPGGGFPASFGPGGACPNPGEGTTSLSYTVPTTFPSGVVGSLYKVEVRVTDHAGNATTVRSASPFYIVQPNPDTVRTLILKNTARMQSQMGVTSMQAAALSSKLAELAAHPRVQGLVVDLGGVTELSDLYSAWDADSSNPDRANQVLFGCHAPLPAGCAAEKNGVHDQIRSLLQAYTGVKYAIVVGDDRIIPFARLQDRTLLLPESAYTLGPDLTAAGTTVGQALSANKYLSDDPLGVVDAVRPDNLSTALYLPDLAVGRLVETPEEITAAIATFISQDGVLDLSVLNPTTGHKVLVTGYDFLTDSAKQIRQRWKTVFGADPDPNSLSPVDGELVGGNWGLGSVSARVAALETHLGGNGGARYGVSSLSGHANHYQEGVPGTNPFDIDGLDASSIAGLNLAGGVIYAVGCHGGLAVPGSNPADADHSLDLPQTFLSRGVVAYVANTGFGWGLKHGIGYGERLVQLLTEEMTKGGTIVTGEAVKKTKQKYYLESPRFDAYDQKSLMQWTLFGLPMYGVKTGLASGGKPGVTDEAPGARAALERVGRVRVKRSAETSVSNQTQTALPSYLTQLNLHFDFTAPGVYRKWTAGGDDVTASSPSGCPDANGCYYTLNGQVERAGGMTDLPVQPYFIYDSRLSGTSQHGVIWKGGVYEQESGWVSILGELQSNGGDGSEHGPLPEEMTIDVVTNRTVPGQDPDQCRPSELELNSLVVNAGEALKDQGTGLYSIERKYREIDLEVFYFNNTVTPTNNCDREGPAFGSGPHHSVSGTTIQFAVPVADASGVWRVLVVYNKNAVDGLGQGRWEPLELTNDGGVWRGSVTLTGVTRLTYMLQAVDNRGNVSWLRFESAELPASGVPLGIPLAVRVALVSPTGSGSLIDYDRDNRSDHTVFHSASGTWYLRNSTTGAVSAVGYGGPGYTLVPGDYDGDGITDLGVYHPPSGLWFIRNSTTMSTTTTGFGGPDYKPVRGDFDGDGKTDLAVFHDPTGLWFIKRSSTETVDTIGYGASGYVPVPGDYDGDGKTDLAVYHPPTGLWFTRASSTLATTTTGFGGMAYKPVRGDFDGDARDDIAVYHEASGLWFLKNSSDGAVTTLGYGGPGYVPVPGRYDADVKTDIAVYHEPSGLWYMKSSLTGASTALGFGGSGYSPVN